MGFKVRTVIRYPLFCYPPESWHNLIMVAAALVSIYMNYQRYISDVSFRPHSPQFYMHTHDVPGCVVGTVGGAFYDWISPHAISS